MRGALSTAMTRGVNGVAVEVLVGGALPVGVAVAVGVLVGVAPFGGAGATALPQKVMSKPLLGVGLTVQE